MDPSHAIAAQVRGRVEQRERFFDRIIACRDCI
jgi:hypothetical protein